MAYAYDHGFPAAAQRMKPLVPLYGRIRRRKSDAALIADFKALGKSLLLCATCVAKLPRGWTSRYGYRLLGNMHAVGRCDYCQSHAPCDLYHPEDGDYTRQWVQWQAVQSAAAQQAIAIRDKRRVR